MSSFDILTTVTLGKRACKDVVRKSGTYEEILDDAFLDSTLEHGSGFTGSFACTAVSRASLYEISLTDVLGADCFRLPGN